MLTSRCRSLGVVIAAALALLTLRPAPARAGEAFYLLMFGSQRIPNEPNYAHSFATFVRASWPGDGPCPPAGAALEPYTISWLPQKLPVRTYALLPECGHNYGLRETIQYSLCEKERISLWGAYLICPELFYRAVRQYELLNSGRVRYKAIDSGFPSDKVSNCMHAISSISDGYRLRIASPGWGQMASFSILKELEPWIVDKCQVHTWVGSALGLDVYPLYYRDWQSPRSGAFFGPIYRLFGGERDLAPSYGPPVR